MGRPASISIARESPVAQGASVHNGMPMSQAALTGLPALVVARDGALKFSTPQAALLTENGALKPVLAQHVAMALAEGRAQLVRVTLPEDAGTRRFDLTLMPSVSGEVLILAKETSIEANLVSALTKSPIGCVFRSEDSRKASARAFDLMIRATLDHMI